MSSYYYLFLLFSIFVLPYSNSYRNSKLSLIDQFEIEDLAFKLVEKNSPLLQIILNLSGVTGGISCEACSFLVDVLKNFLLQKEGLQKFYELLRNVCHLTKIDNKVCDGALNLYEDIVYDGLIKRFVNGEYICSMAKICNDTNEYESVDDYARRILPGKPEIKQKEIVKRKNDEDYYKVVQVTDIHLDMDYKPGAVANCILPLCCRELADDDLVPVKQILAGKYGTTGKCDANIETVKAFAEKAKELNPDYIMFTGDNIAHLTWKVRQEDVINATKMQIEAIQEVFGMDTPIYPALGNHEKAPVDEFHGDETELLHNLADIFRPYLDDDAYETFRKYGYYTMMVKDNLRIISVNCLICDSFNFNLLYDSSQPRLMFKWLEQVLSDAEKNGEIVHIMNHIPIANTQHTTQCSGRYKVLLDRYQNIIRGLFSGHSHSEYLTIVHEYYHPEVPTQVNYICSGLTTYSEYQPSFRLYLVDKSELYVQDFIQYRMNLTESNEQDTPVWFIPYNATELLGVDSMNDLEGISKYIVTPEYVQHKYTDVPGSEEKGKDPEIIHSLQCVYDNDNLDGLMNCTGYSIFSEDYLHVILNKIATKWLK